VCYLFVAYHLLWLNKAADFFAKTKTTSTNPLNVYSETDQSEVLRCMSAVGELLGRVEELLNEFPENNVLASLIDAVQKFFGADAKVPLMKLASLLENVLGMTHHLCFSKKF
jgi:midasin (ATPase involved in ribosome maturation)